MDGAFRPNDLLEAAAVVLARRRLTSGADAPGLLVSSGRSLLGSTGRAAPAASFDADISALAGLPDGGAAVGLVDGRIAFVGGPHDGKTIAAKPEVRCVTALAAGAGRRLAGRQWLGDARPGRVEARPMEKNASGSVWRLEPTSGALDAIGGGLAYPNGLLDEGDSIVVSESWRCALTRFARRRARAPVLEDLPAYPGRLSKGADQAIWLALFAPRSQLVEFVLSEDRYRRRMIEEIDADFWVAPCLRSGRSPLEPIQQGGVKQLGVEAVVAEPLLRPDRASRQRVPSVASLHSRANGRRHGVTSCLAFRRRLYFTAKGDGIVGACADEGAMP